MVEESAKENRGEIMNVLLMLTNEQSLQILAACQKPKTISEIAEKYGIPLASAYRKAKELVSAGLLDIVGRKFTEASNQQSYQYRTSLREFRITYKQGILGIVIKRDWLDDIESSKNYNEV